MFIFLNYSPLIANCDSVLLKWDKQQGSFISRRNELKQIISSLNLQIEELCYTNALRRLGFLYKKNGQSDSAIFYFIESAKIAEKLGYNSGLASTYNELSLAYYDLEKDSLAIVYFEKTIYYYEIIKSYKGIADATFNLSQIYYQLDSLALAEKKCLLSLSYRNTLKDTSNNAYNYQLLSRIYLEQQNPKLALNYAKLATTNFNYHKNYTGLIAAYLELADIYKSNHQTDSINYYLQKSYALAKSIQTKTWIVTSAKALSENFKLLQRFDSSLFYHEIYSVYQDSLIQLQNAQAAINALTQYDTEKKELELQAQKEINKKNTLVATGLIGLLILSLIIIFSLVRNFKQRKKIHAKENELQNANTLLQGQDEERERIARELHDRVGSMISTVKLHFSNVDKQFEDLIKVQHQSYTTALNLLDDTYDEVRRISHDLDTGLLGKFGLKTAMLQLTQVIESTNILKIAYLDNNINPELYKNHETDLYRITQELLSNTIKYAQAKEVSIQLSRNNGNLVYSYEDDGKGFVKDTLHHAKGMGYRNIEMRVKKMKGQWHLDTSLNNGLNLIIEIPIYGNTSHHS